MVKKLFSVTASDCRFDYYRGRGTGGQKKNKTESAVRCTHIASGAVGACEEHRSQLQNKKTAFERMANTNVFQKWLHIEAMRRSGQLAEIEAKIDYELRTQVKVEVKDENGRWIEESEDALI